jgi:hypothetical protein
MDNININNLFPLSNSRSSVDKPLDVTSLYNFDRPQNIELEANVKTEINFSVESIINERKEKKRIIHNRYRKITDMCLNKIKSANKINKTDIVFNIPLTVFGCHEYNSDECLDYMEYKLRKLYMDTYILSKTAIFVSWLNIENNMKDSKK